MKLKLKKVELDKISEAVTKAESATSGEIIPLLIAQSDFYPAAHFRLGIIFSFTFALVAYNFYPHWTDPLTYFYLQIAGFILGYFLTYLPFIKKFMTTHEERVEEVHQRAMKGFFQHGLHTTKDRTGILIMISFLEKRVEILADSGINAQVDPKTWEKLVQDLITKIHQGKLVDGLCESIQECGKILSVKFPLRPDDKNELKNDLIME